LRRFPSLPALAQKRSPTQVQAGVPPDRQRRAAADLSNVRLVIHRVSPSAFWVNLRVAFSHVIKVEKMYPCLLSRQYVSFFIIDFTGFYTDANLSDVAQMTTAVRYMKDLEILGKRRYKPKTYILEYVYQFMHFDHLQKDWLYK
jgi:hypothetical protein